jgi:hypothetical protein
MSPSLRGERPVMSTVTNMIEALVRSFAGARIASFRGEHPVREAAPAGASPTGHENSARIVSFRGEHPVREAAPAGASPTGHKNRVS